METKSQRLATALLALAFLLSARAGFSQHRGSWADGPPAGSPEPGQTRAATAEGVGLASNADCTSNANLDITLTTSGATREFGLTTLVDGTTLFHFEQGTNIGNFSGTFFGYGQPIGPPLPDNTLIGSYAYVGETPPDHSNTAEFFLLFNCTTREILVSCFGPYGTCPQTAQEAIAVPAAPPAALLALALLLAAAGALAARRRATARAGERREEPAALV